MIIINEFIIFNVIPIIVLEALGGVPLRVFQSIREMGRALGLYPYVMIMSIRYYIAITPSSWSFRRKYKSLLGTSVHYSSFDRAKKSEIL